MTPNFAALRREFPVLERKTYLNSGSYCALANEVKAAFEAYLEDRLRVGADWDLWVAKNESVRDLVASLNRPTHSPGPSTSARSWSQSPTSVSATAAGIGFLYARDALVPSLVPANSGWFAQERIGSMDIMANRPAPNARRFEAGTSAVVNCYGDPTLAADGRLHRFDGAHHDRPPTTPYSEPLPPAWGRS